MELWQAIEKTRGLMRRWIRASPAPELESIWNICCGRPHVVRNGRSNLVAAGTSHPYTLAWLAVGGFLFSLPGWAMGAVPEAWLQRASLPMPGVCML